MGVAGCLAPVVSKQLLEELTAFDLLDPTQVPDPDEVVAKAAAWASGGTEELSDRIQVYSTDEVPETPVAQAPKRQTRRRSPGAGTGGREAGPKRPTVASLAESLETLTNTLPAITARRQDLHGRTEVMEMERAQPPGRPSALRKPLATSTISGSPRVSVDPAALLRQMLPPKSATSIAKTHGPAFSKAETVEYAQNMGTEGSDLAKAVLEQSKALTPGRSAT